MRKVKQLFIAMVVAGSAAMHAADLSQVEKYSTVFLLPPSGTVRLVQRELLTLPGYTVFDYLSCKQLEDGSVVLTGQVTNSNLKKSAEEAAIAVAGPAQIVNRIEILPDSARDKQLRSMLYHQIYNDDSMMTYAIRNVAPIHIIVKNGQVTLEGVVDSSVDRMHVESAVQYASGAGTTVHLTNHLIATRDTEPLLSSMWRSNEFSQ